MFRGLVLVTFLAVVSAAVVADEKPDKALEVLQGTWRIESFVIDGKKVPPPERIAKQTYSISDNRMIIADGADSTVTVIKLDPARSPAWIDVIDEKTKETARGIYELAGDRLKICSARKGDERPKEFGSRMYVVLKRQRS